MSSEGSEARHSAARVNEANCHKGQGHLGQWPPEDVWHFSRVPPRKGGWQKRFGAGRSAAISCRRSAATRRVEAVKIGNFSFAKAGADNCLPLAPYMRERGGGKEPSVATSAQPPPRKCHRLFSTPCGKPQYIWVASKRHAARQTEPIKRRRGANLANLFSWSAARAALQTSCGGGSRGGGGERQDMRQDRRVPTC